MADLFFSTGFFNWAMLPLLIFFARIIDVSLGTIRVIFISKGMKFLAPIIGFFEILVWLFAIGGIINNLNTPAIFIAYASGFATGTFVGIWLEEKLSIGKVLIQVVVKNSAQEIVEQLKQHNFKSTSINAEGYSGQVKLIFEVIERKKVKQFIDLVKSIEPDAFYSIEDVKTVSEGLLVPKKKIGAFEHLFQHQLFRKGK